MTRSPWSYKLKNWRQSPQAFASHRKDQKSSTLTFDIQAERGPKDAVSRGFNGALGIGGASAVEQIHATRN